MAIYYIYLNHNLVAKTEGLEYSAYVWGKTKDLANIMVVNAWLIDGNTGELLEEFVGEWAD